MANQTIVKTIVIREEQSQIKTIVVNKGPKGTTGSIANFQAITRSFTLTPQNIIDKSIYLNPSPANNDVLLVPDGGTTQIFGLQYTLINNNQISWANMGLDGFLEEGDVLYVTYQVET